MAMIQFLRGPTDFQGMVATAIARLILPGFFVRLPQGRNTP